MALGLAEQQLLLRVPALCVICGNMQTNVGGGEEHVYLSGVLLMGAFSVFRKALASACKRFSVVVQLVVQLVLVFSGAITFSVALVCSITLFRRHFSIARSDPKPLVSALRVRFWLFFHRR